MFTCRKASLIDALIWLLVMMTLMASALAEEAGVVFHLPFDGTIVAEAAKQKIEGQLSKPGADDVAFVEGINGQAVYLKNTSLFFPIQDVFSVTQGTISFWMKPVDWDPQKPSDAWRTFFDAHQSSGGGGDDKIAFFRYPQTMYDGAYNFHSAQGNHLDSWMLQLKGWKQNQWRFFVFTWEKDGTQAMYVDGQRIAKGLRPKDKLPVLITRLAIGGGGNAYDEFKIYREPLSEEEIDRQFNSLKSRAALLSTPKWDFPAGPATLYASPMSGTIKLDGRIDEPSWEGCVEVRDMRGVGGGFPADPTAFRVGYTPETLYIAVEVQSKAVKPVMKVRDHDGPVFGDDSIELFIAPVAGSNDYYQFVTNALGTQYEGHRLDKSWNGDWQVAAARGERKWTLEYAIPFATLGIQPTPGKVLGFNLCRNDISGGGAWQSWAYLPMSNYHDPLHFGHLVLGDQPIGLKNLTVQRTSAGSSLIKASVMNPTDKVIDMTIGLDLKTRAGTFTPLINKEVKPGERTLLDLELPKAFKEPGQVVMGLMARSGEKLLYLSPGREVPYETIPMAEEPNKFLRLENNKICLTFNAVSGDLISMVNKVKGVEIRPRQQASPLFSLDTVPFKTKPLYYNEDDIQVLKPSGSSCLQCRIEKQTLRQRHRFTSGVEVEVSVTLPENSEISLWRIRINNQVTSHPSQSVVVHRVVFPFLHGLRVDERDNEQSLAVPQICGLLVPSPAANLSKIPSYMLSTERGIDEDYLDGHYSPSWLSMTWMDLSGTRGGLYLASHDKDPMYDTRFDIANDQANGEMELAITRWSYCWPGESWQPGPCSVGLHPSDWHWSADRYHEWFYSTFKPRPLPQWLRQMNGWTESGGGALTYTWNDLPDAVRRAKPFNLHYLQKWCNMVGGEIGYAAFPYPNPYAGSFFEFKRAISTIHEMGGRIGFYHNLTTGDPTLGRFAGQPRYRQKIPPDVPIPDVNPFKNNWLDQCKITPSGSYPAGGGEPCYLDGYWWNCWGAKNWMDFCFDWYANRWRKQYKLDACYLDSTGPEAYPCFNLRHGHDKPAGQMQFLLDFYKRLAEGTDPDYGILQEFVWDRLMIHGTHSLTTFHLGPFSEPGLYRYTHPDYPLFCGCVNFFGGRADLMNGVLKDPTWPEFLSYVFLYGGRFDHYGVSDQMTEPEDQLLPETREEKAVLVLRNRLCDDLNNKTDFKDQLGLSGLPEKCFSRIFVRRDKSAVLLTFFDLRSKKEPFTLSINLKAHALNQVTRAELFVGCSESKTGLVPAVKDGVAQISVPTFTGKVAAIRVLTK